MKYLLIFLAVLALGRVQASDRDFVLVNETGRSFEAVYLSATGNPDWDGNLLGDRLVLKAGGRVLVKFPAADSSPLWDLNVVDDEGLAVRFDRLRLEGVDTITLKDVRGKITAEVE